MPTGEWVQFLSSGILLGLAAGFSPGPLLVLVISETIQHDIRAGIKVALAPVITDLPIVLVTVLVLVKLAAFRQILGWVSLAGGGFVFYLGFQSIRTRAFEIAPAPDVIASPLKKGILMNFLNPNPYLFWFSVGAPTTVKALSYGIPAVIAFIGSFYLFLVGSKVVLAIATGKSKKYLSGRLYLATMRVLGILLMILALFIVMDGFKMIGTSG
jgi:threonine/homoserine/homoserine lactone efflux protein